MTNEELNRNFKYHSPTGNKQEYCNQIRNSAKSFAGVVMYGTRPSREQSLALTNIEQAMFWANASVARYEEAGLKLNANS